MCQIRKGTRCQDDEFKSARSRECLAAHEKRAKELPRQARDID